LNSFNYYKEEFSKIKGVEMVSASTFRPTSINQTSYDFNWEGKDKEAKFQFYLNTISFDFIETYHIPLIEGRGFSNEYPSDASTAFIVNEECARQMGFDKALGKKMSWGNRQGEIIGIIKNYIFQSFKKSVNPLVLFIDAENWSEIHLKVNSSINRQEILQNLKKIWEKSGSSEPFTYSLIEDEFNIQYKGELMLSKSLIYLTVIAIIIALLGIIGLIIHLVGKSKKEIAIRKVNGASELTLLLMFSWNYVSMMLIAICLSVPVVFYFMNKWLNTFELHIKIGPQHFIYALLLICLLTQMILISIIRKTIKLNPSKVLAEL